MNLRDRVMSRDANRLSRRPGGEAVSAPWADPMRMPGSGPSPARPEPGVGTGGDASRSVPFSFGPNPDISGPRYRLAQGAPSWGRLQGSGVEPPPGTLPDVGRSADRIASINAGTPALFHIDDSMPGQRSPREFAADQAQWDQLGRTAVQQNDEAIRRHAAKAGIDPDLLRAVVFMENARGYYGQISDAVRENVPEWLRQDLNQVARHRLPPGLRFYVDALRKTGSVLPANINPDLWHIAGLDRRTAYEPERNIEAAAHVLRGLIDRTPDPTPAKIASMWHFTGNEQVDHFGELVGRAYLNKPWLEPAGPDAADQGPPLREPSPAGGHLGDLR